MHCYPCLQWLNGMGQDTPERSGPHPAAEAKQCGCNALTILEQALGGSQHLVRPGAAALPHHLQQPLRDVGRAAQNRRFRGEARRKG